MSPIKNFFVKRTNQVASIFVVLAVVGLLVANSTNALISSTFVASETTANVPAVNDQAAVTVTTVNNGVVGINADLSLDNITPLE